MNKEILELSIREKELNIINLTKEINELKDNSIKSSNLAFERKGKDILSNIFKKEIQAKKEHLNILIAEYDELKLIRERN